ncbi:restriction endonuclease subunit S [Staphylococcus auricularis]|uniref:restriction endonuclease subunit S n=1 Tax=Staphylococcus auricularis TaxID=29379 RepID=UPI0019327B75|nr:restriction endonuclease subunit S [Staphylococcus auricularis]MBM0868879.1 hypothetical protein [Staphylococcus auricularis]
MMKLSDREWRAFEVGQLFSEIKIALSSDSNHLKKGNTPFVGRSYNFNGYQGLYNVEKFKINEAGLITLSMVGTPVSFIQPFEFACSQNILLLKCNNNNFYAKLFIVTIINKSLKDGGYGYGHPMSLFRFKRKKVKLPISLNGLPDYNFMEQYIKEKNFNLKSQIKEKQKHEITDWRELNEVEWDNYFIESLFQIKSGKRLTKKEFRIGKTPFIGSSDHNNGVTDFVDNHNSSEDFNVLGVNYNGSVVENFYHPYTALFSDDVKRLSLKANGNKYLYLFIKNMILSQKKKYQYGYKFNGARMKKQIIKLPTKYNKPDYDFMEQYMKRKENEILDRI